MTVSGPRGAGTFGERAGSADTGAGNVTSPQLYTVLRAREVSVAVVV